MRQDVLRARTLANPDDPLAGLFVRKGEPHVIELQSTAEHARAHVESQTAEVPEECASGEENEEDSSAGSDCTAATAALAAAELERLAQKQQAWKMELLHREPMIDMGVYTKNRCFRMYLCAKFNNDDPAR